MRFALFIYKNKYNLKRVNYSITQIIIFHFVEQTDRKVKNPDVAWPISSLESGSMIYKTAKSEQSSTYTGYRSDWWSNAVNIQHPQDDSDWSSYLTNMQRHPDERFSRPKRVGEAEPGTRTKRKVCSLFLRSDTVL